VTHNVSPYLQQSSLAELVALARHNAQLVCPASPITANGRPKLKAGSSSLPKMETGASYLHDRRVQFVEASVTQFVHVKAVLVHISLGRG